MVAGWNWIFEPGGHKSSGYIMLSGQWSPSQECEIGNEECFGATTVPTRTCSCILSARFIAKGCIYLCLPIMWQIFKSFPYYVLCNMGDQIWPKG